MTQTAEHVRLEGYHKRTNNWKHWGPYLSERAWGTVREDYSSNGDAWNYFSHGQARSRAYRWNEDGLAGICDRNQYLCFAIALWNGKDPILKERLFGLTNAEGNHGEDVKEYYFYLDSTPTHSYMKMLYKYPQTAFPYRKLIEENRQRGFSDFEYELLDTGIFAAHHYFDVMVEYAKADENDILIRITMTNQGPNSAPCHLLPTLWFRNTWSWGYENGPLGDVRGRPLLTQKEGPAGSLTLTADHPQLGHYHLWAESDMNTPMPEIGDSSRMLFTENETNSARLFGSPNRSPYVKDACHRYLIHGESDAINPAGRGTKAAFHFAEQIPAGTSRTYRLRLAQMGTDRPFGREFDETFQQRINEADEFYAAIQKPDLNDDERLVQRQALAGMLWNKQLYYFDTSQWLHGDPIFPASPDRANSRNRDWDHLHNFDIISMPDKWEYPWYATWDLAFHCLPLALVDMDFAKRQLALVTREWYMHPNGALPAYEWHFGDANPPVHAWAVWRVYKMDARQKGRPDRAFLESIFHKLLLNFTWWVNRKDAEGLNVFQGGFLGLDNISVFDRSAHIPTGGRINQSDGTAWMGFYCLMMMKMSLELAGQEPVYQDMATKFFEHFLRIATAMNDPCIDGISLWDEEDRFYYDVLHLPDGTLIPLKVRSLVGLLPLVAVETLEPALMSSLPDFNRRTHWFLKNRPFLATTMSSIDEPGSGERYLTSLLTKDRLMSVLRYLLDEEEFLSPYGIRSLSKVHAKQPYCIQIAGQTFEVHYEPAESRTSMYGGNSNWRGPVWFPLNFLLIESLQRFHHYYGDGLKVECPTGSGVWKTLDEVAVELSQRLMRLFLRNRSGKRPIYGNSQVFQKDPHWRDQILFYEYFHGDNGRGLGASHQTGWTGLVAKLLQQSGGLPLANGES